MGLATESQMSQPAFETRSIILVLAQASAAGRFLLPRICQSREVIAVSRVATGKSGWIQGDLNDRATTRPQAQTVISLGPLDAFTGWLQRYPVATPQRGITLSSMSARSKRDSNDPHERDLAARLVADHFMAASDFAYAPATFVTRDALLR